MPRLRNQNACLIPQEKKAPYTRSSLPKKPPQLKTPTDCCGSARPDDRLLANGTFSHLQVNDLRRRVGRVSAHDAAPIVWGGSDQTPVLRFTHVSVSAHDGLVTA